MDRSCSIADTLIELINRHSSGDGDFVIPVDEVLMIFGTDLTAFHRRLYERRNFVATIAPKQFDHTNLRDLVVGICDDLASCEHELQRRGILLSVDHQLELSELVIEAANTAVRTHEVDFELFAGMRRRYPNTIRAVDCYISFCFDIDELKHIAVARFIELHSDMHIEIARIRAREMIELLFNRHILTEHMLFRSIADKLNPEPEPEPGVSAMEDPRIATALSVLGLASPPASAFDLKRIYRTLMKTYHPDKNPAGLEMSQRITAAYGYLTSTLRLPDRIDRPAHRGR